MRRVDPGDDADGDGGASPAVEDETPLLIRVAASSSLELHAHRTVMFARQGVIDSIYIATVFRVAAGLQHALRAEYATQSGFPSLGSVLVVLSVEHSGSARFPK